MPQPLRHFSTENRPSPHQQPHVPSIFRPEELRRGPIIEGPPPDPTSRPPLLPEAHLLPISGQKITPQSTAWSRKLSREPIPIKHRGRYQRLGILENVLAFLDVESSSRYQPRQAGGGTRTYCNVYAADFTHQCGLYIPRVWWLDRSLRAIEAGEQVTAIYGETVFECSANMMFRWLLKHGDDFGWHVKRLSEFGPELLSVAVRAADSQGFPGVICGLRKRIRGRRRSGHVSVLLPTMLHPEPLPELPVQSHAGTKNKRLHQDAWYLSPLFEDVAVALPIPFGRSLSSI